MFFVSFNKTYWIYIFIIVQFWIEYMAVRMRWHSFYRIIRIIHGKLLKISVIADIESGNGSTAPEGEAPAGPVRRPLLGKRLAWRARVFLHNVTSWISLFLIDFLNRLWFIHNYINFLSSHQLFIMRSLSRFIVILHPF